MNRSDKKAWVVSADMGYGHQRAVYPLKNIAEDGMITCYPNPTEGMVYLQGVTDGNVATAVVRGVDGKIIMVKELQVYDYLVEEVIDLGNCEKGLYLITVLTVEKSTTFKIILN